MKSVVSLCSSSRKTTCSSVDFLHWHEKKMQTRQQKQTSIQALHTALAAARAAGLTSREVQAAVAAEYSPACASLPASVVQAFRTPASKASVQIIEAVEADALTALRGWPGHRAPRCDLGTVKKQAADTVYVRDMSAREFQREVVSSRAFLSATQHNLGVDIIEFYQWLPDDNCYDVVLRQQKVGKTAIGNGTAASNENRSMPHILEKMAKAGEAVIACMGEEFDATALIHYALDTTSPIRQGARDKGVRNGLEINDATDLWAQVWPKPVKNALLELYGTEARAKGLGVVL